MGPFARHALDLLAWTPTFHPPTCNACLVWPHTALNDLAKRGSKGTLAPLLSQSNGEAEMGLPLHTQG